MDDDIHGEPLGLGFRPMRYEPSVRRLAALERYQYAGNTALRSPFRGAGLRQAQSARVLGAAV